MIGDIIVISDTHIEDKRSDINVIKEMLLYIKNEKKNTVISKLIIAGDFLDSWCASKWNIGKIFSKNPYFIQKVFIK